MRVILAPDSFKGSASAAEVATALAEGWLSIRPDDELQLLPMADGGEGTLDAFEAAVGGSQRMPITVTGPDNRPIDAAWLLLPGEPGSTTTGVVELASTSGITLLDPLLPFDSHTVGFGHAIAAALDYGVTRLLLAIGGSASTDGGAGALSALGARFLNVDGQSVADGNAGLAQIASADLTGLMALPAGGATILTDVSNPLLGAFGAAAVFGPQKGADAAGVVELESNLEHFARFLPADPTVAGVGAAGGTGFGLVAWGATLAQGAEAVGATLGLPAAIRRADVVVTGEGRFDAQSAAGKVPMYVGALAAASGVPVMLAAGSILASTHGFAEAESLVDLGGGLTPALNDPLRWLHEAGARLAASYAPAQGD